MSKIIPVTTLRIIKPVNHKSRFVFRLLLSSSYVVESYAFFSSLYLMAVKYIPGNYQNFQKQFHTRIVQKNCDFNRNVVEVGDVVQE